MGLPWCHRYHCQIHCSRPYDICFPPGPIRSLQVANNSDVIFVAVKPQHVSGVLQELRPVLKASHTIVSIAAGITLET